MSRPRADLEGWRLNMAKACAGTAQIHGVYLMCVLPEGHSSELHRDGTGIYWTLAGPGRTPDPNALLRRAREAVTAVRADAPGYLNPSIVLADALTELDEWLSAGGTLPDDWLGSG
jgi:hypothetical protein